MDDLKEIKECVERQEQTLNRLHIFLVGDEKLQTKGLKHTVEYHSKKIKEYEIDKAKAIGWSSAMGAVFGAIASYFISLFKNP